MLRVREQVPYAKHLGEMMWGTGREVKAPEGAPLHHSTTAALVPACSAEFAPIFLDDGVLTALRTGLHSGH